MVKNIDCTYANADLEQVSANETHINTEDRTQLIGILKYCEDFFDGTIWDWDTELIKLGLKPNYKPFNCKYYPVPRIKNDTFHKYLECIVGIGALTPVQNYQ